VDPVTWNHQEEEEVEEEPAISERSSAYLGPTVISEPV
jgi:hypothetical protein